MREYLEFVFNNYQNLPRLIDSENDIYQTIVRKIPAYLKSNLNRDDFLLQGSVGKGYTTPHPWVSILNKNII